MYWQMELRPRPKVSASRVSSRATSEGRRKAEAVCRTCRPVLVGRYGGTRDRVDFSPCLPHPRGVRQLHTLLRNSTTVCSHLLTRLVSFSALLRHHRLLSDVPVFQPSTIELFCVTNPSDSCSTMKHSAAESLVSVVNVCFQRKHLETHLFSHSFPVPVR